LGLPYEAEALDYGELGVLPGRFVDPKSIHRHSTVVDQSADAWREQLADGRNARLAREFLCHLGPDIVDDLGYSFDEIDQQIAKNSSLSFSPPWRSLVKPKAERGALESAYVTADHFLVGAGRRRLGSVVLAQVSTRIAQSKGVAARALLKNSAFSQWTRTALRALRRVPDAASTDYEMQTESAPAETHDGWLSASVAAGQAAAYDALLQEMRKGKPTHRSSVPG
jgi:hypothetical protein